MRKVLIPVITVVLTLAGCEQPGGSGQSGENLATERDFAAPSAAPPPSPVSFDVAVSDTPAADAAGDTGSMQFGNASVLLAYRYAVSLELPARRVRGAVEAHQAECRAAGPGVCQVLSSSFTAYGDDNLGASLTLRAAPGWLATFRGGLETDARAANGRIVATNVQAEDLTRSMVDTEARLRAKRTLRDRLEKLLATQSDDIGDLLAVERELARVQSELDAAQSSLEIVRTRVDMALLDLNYQSTPAALSRNAFAPIGRAFTDFTATFSSAVALLIKLVAVLTPFVMVGAPLVWFLRRWWRGRRAGKATLKD